MVRSGQGERLVAHGGDAEVLQHEPDRDVGQRPALELRQGEAGLEAEVGHEAEDGLVRGNVGGHVTVGGLDAGPHGEAGERVTAQEIIGDVRRGDGLGDGSPRCTLAPLVVAGEGDVEEPAAETEAEVVEPNRVDDPLEARVGDPAVVREGELRVLQNGGRGGIRLEETGVACDGGGCGAHALETAAERNLERREDRGSRVCVRRAPDERPPRVQVSRSGSRRDRIEAEEKQCRVLRCLHLHH